MASETSNPIDLFTTFGAPGDGPRACGSVSLRQTTAVDIKPRKGRSLKRSNSIEISEPPLQHVFTAPSADAYSRPGSSRPVTPSGFTPAAFVELPKALTGDKLLALHHEARQMVDKDAMTLPAETLTLPWKTCFVLGVLALSLLLVATILLTTLLLLAKPSDNKGDKSTETATETTPTVERPTPHDVTTPIPTPIPTLGIDIIIQENATYGGAWLGWTGWGECSASCAGGFRYRNRTCDSEELQCQGVSAQQELCNQALCLVDEPESVWLTWGAWAACSHTCGSGVQVRSRLCVTFNDSSLYTESCEGEPSQDRPCNLFSCLDCEPDCEAHDTGNLCPYCACADTISGQVLSETNLPVNNSTFSPALAPYLVGNRTGPGGYFTLEGVCMGDMYVVTKQGYMDADVIAVDTYMNITLQSLVSLQLHKVPGSTMGVTGRQVSLCCHATGCPPPAYYEWMKDGLVIQTDYTEGESTLTLGAVSLTDTSSYSCRASNDFSAVFSPAAALIVKETADEFCAIQPQSYIVTLPTGCIYHNSSTIDKGRCENNPCYGREQEECTSSSTHCCVPASLTRVVVECDQYSLPVYLVTSCGCGLCQQRGLTIYGFAGSRDGLPLQYGDVFWNGSLVTNTSADGTFSFTVDYGFPRASVLFVDNFNRTFMDSTYVFEAPTNSEDSQYIRVILIARGHVFDINTETENTLDLSTSAIQIPAGSFYTESGELYTGAVQVTIATIDVSDVDALAAAPGDLTIVDEEGDSQPLLSYGMFGMIFEDDSDNRLSIPGEISVTILPSMLGDTEDISEVKVWTLNPTTGVWQFSSNLQEIPAEATDRKKRQIRQWGWGQRRFTATLRGIPIHVQWFNFDAISTQTCIVKVRLFENNRYLEQSQLAFGRVSVVVQDSYGYNSISTNRVSTDRGNHNGFCMVTPCRSRRRPSSATFRGYIFADHLSEQLIPAGPDDNNGMSNSEHDLVNALSYVIRDRKIQVDLNQNLVASEGRGPYYDWQSKWRYSYSCSSARFDKNHFRFARETVSCLTELDSFTPDYVYAYVCENLRLWYDINSYLPRHASSPWSRNIWAFRTCYIKVLAPVDTRIRAVSYIADERHFYFAGERDLWGTSEVCATSSRDTDVYGTREDCATDGAVCIEVRPPGSPRVSAVAHDVTDYSLDDERKTRIRVRSLSSEHRVVGIAAALLSASHLSGDIITQSDSHSQDFEMLLSYGTSYGSAYGIYCDAGQTQAEAERALYQCRHGYNSRVPRTDTTLHAWAVQFDLAPLARGTGCAQLRDLGYTQDGIYTIDPDGLGDFNVYCELDPTRADGTSGAGWTVFQRRVDASVSFYRGWAEYETGFGDLGGNQWLGLRHISRLTAAGSVQLHVYLEQFDGQWAYASYNFHVSGASDNYRLAVSGYSGTAGDSLQLHNGRPFSTFDNLNNVEPCAIRYSGAWWYNTCHYANLNGLYLGGAHSTYANGINWYHYTGYHYSLKTTVMKIRPVS